MADPPESGKVGAHNSTCLSFLSYRLLFFTHSGATVEAETAITLAAVLGIGGMVLGGIGVLADIGLEIYRLVEHSKYEHSMVTG